MFRTGLSWWTALSVLALAAFLSSSSLAASDRPLSWQQDAGPESILESRSLPPLDTAKLAAEDAVAEAFGQPPRFAMPFELAETPAKAGDWTVWGDTASWRLRVIAEDAVSLNFGFRNVRLIEGAKLWIYTADAAEKGVLDRFEVLGPFGPEINEKHGEFWTPVLASGDVIIELEVPASQRNEVFLELAQVNQGYRGFGQVAEGYRQPEGPDGEGKREGECGKGDFGAKSGSCNMDVACLAPDDPWNEPSRSVARYTLQGQFLCTGSLVNNTANDRRMLFATASHCGVSAGNAATIVAYWNYEWPTCRTPGASVGTLVNSPDPTQTNSGADYLAGTRDPFSSQACPNAGECSDFTLVEFDDPANPDFELFWAGWDRRSTPASCGPQGAAGSTAGLCASIHHPSGHEKRITFVDSDLESGSISFAQGVHWHAFWHPNPPVVSGISPPPASIPPGVTEPGSSGSPLYSADRRLVGVLSGGPAFCGATGVNLSDFYGQLAHAWNGLGSPSTRMRDHLDPVGSNAQFIDGLGASAFRLETTDDFVEACRADGSAQVGIDIDADAGFNSPVSFSVTGAPSGSSTSFSPNPATPANGTTLTIGSLGSAATGPATLSVQGSAGGATATVLVPFHVGSSVPGSASPAAPADGAAVNTSSVSLSWAGSGSSAAGYRVEVATDFAFSNVVFDRVVRGATSVVAELDSRTQYFWRVTAQNGCGTAQPSATRSFITAPQPGECPVGQLSAEFWSDDMESGTNGWTLGSGSTQNTWARITSDSVSGNVSWNAINVDSISDQRLVSPPIDLPAEGELTLRFQNRQELEDAGSAGCFDGAVLEISTDNGSSWTQLGDNRIAFRDYDGPIDPDFGNPLADTPAWCGDPRGWEDYAVDLSDFAGQTIRLRYRVVTDDSIGGRDGWLIDDVRVQGCGGVAPEAPVSGNWFNPARSGEGCQLTREANGSTFILTCYVYNQNDAFATDQVWMIGTGEVADGSFVSDNMVITAGADYGSAFDPDDVVRIPFGTVRMDFDDCNTGTVSMNPVVAGFSNVVLPMQKIVPVDCAGGIPDPANAARSGNWFNAARSGEGFQLAVEGSNGVHVITFYTYLDGEPVWLIGTGTVQGDTIVFADTVITSGTGFGANFDAADVVRTPFGTLTLNFSDCNNATIDVDSVLPQFEDQTIAVTRIVQGQCP
jgi:hypothetical protein